MKYGVKPGAHLTEEEAQIVGEAMEDCARASGAGYSTKDFEAYCSNPRTKVHQVWLKKRDEIRNSAGRSAAAYLMRSIILVEHIGSDGPPKAATTLLLSDGFKREGYVYDRATLAGSEDLVETAATQYATQLRGIATSFADVGGIRRMLEVTELVMKEFRSKLPKKAG